VTLRPQDVEALRVVSAVLSEEGWPFVIVGARAPWILLADHTWRATRDVDAVVRTPTWEAFERLAERLKALGFARPALHHFVSPGGAEVDLHRHVRGKDVGDVVQVFERYEEDDGRRFEAIGVTVDDGPITFEEAGAYLVGVGAARLARPKSGEVVKAFLAGFTDEYAQPVSRVLAEEQRSHSERRSRGLPSERRSRSRATFPQDGHVVAEEVLVELPERPTFADEFVGEAMLFEGQERQEKAEHTGGVSALGDIVRTEEARQAPVLEE
jgi:predicted nucleotidyltransferase